MQNVSTYVDKFQVYLSTTFGIPLWLLMRMMYNITVDFLFTFIPVLGGFLHMFYKANLYNYEEMCNWYDNPSGEYGQRVKAGERSSSAAGPPPGEITWTQLGKDLAQLVIKSMNSTKKSVIEQRNNKKKPE